MARGRGRKEKIVYPWDEDFVSYPIIIGVVEGFIPERIIDSREIIDFSEKFRYYDKYSGYHVPLYTTNVNHLDNLSDIKNYINTLYDHGYTRALYGDYIYSWTRIINVANRQSEHLALSEEGIVFNLYRYRFEEREYSQVFTVDQARHIGMELKTGIPWYILPGYVFVAFRKHPQRDHIGTFTYIKGEICQTVNNSVDEYVDGDLV